MLHFTLWNGIWDTFFFIWDKFETLFFPHKFFSEPSPLRNRLFQIIMELTFETLYPPFQIECLFVCTHTKKSNAFVWVQERSARYYWRRNCSHTKALDRHCTHTKALDFLTGSQRCLCVSTIRGAFGWVQGQLHLWGNRVPLCEYNESLWGNRVPLCEYKGTRFSHRWSWPFSEVSLSLSQRETLSISHCLLVREGASVSFETRLYISLSLLVREGASVFSSLSLNFSLRETLSLFRRDTLHISISL